MRTPSPGPSGRETHSGSWSRTLGSEGCSGASSRFLSQGEAYESADSLARFRTLNFGCDKICLLIVLCL